MRNDENEGNGGEGNGLRSVDGVFVGLVESEQCEDGEEGVDDDKLGKEEGAGRGGEHFVLGSVLDELETGEVVLGLPEEVGGEDEGGNGEGGPGSPGEEVGASVCKEGGEGDGGDKEKGSEFIEKGKTNDDSEENPKVLFVWLLGFYPGENGPRPEGEIEAVHGVEVGYDEEDRGEGGKCSGDDLGAFIATQGSNELGKEDNGCEPSDEAR